MIDRISKGRNVVRLLYYLYGPGKSDEHVNPHLVAGWREPIANLEPLVGPDGQRDFRRLGGLLNAPLQAIGRRWRPGTVWHCVLSAAPTDRLLSDAEWNTIATEFMHQVGLADRDDRAGVRWVAVRHGLSKGGIDHIHIAATLARQDGQLPNLHNDFLRARHACQSIEQQFGLTVTAPADRTAAVRPTRAENERSARTGRTEPERITLRRLVQEAAAVAASEADFFDRLRDNGVLIRERRSDTDPNRITGYAIALPRHTSRSGQPIWYSGGKLAPDLTLPKLRHRWERSGNPERNSAHRTENLSRNPYAPYCVLRLRPPRITRGTSNRSSPVSTKQESSSGIATATRIPARSPAMPSPSLDTRTPAASPSGTAEDDCPPTSPCPGSAADGKAKTARARRYSI